MSSLQLPGSSSGVNSGHVFQHKFMPFQFIFLFFLPSRSLILKDPGSPETHIYVLYLAIIDHFYLPCTQKFSVGDSLLLSTKVLIILNHFWGCPFKYIFISHFIVLPVLGKNFRICFFVFMKNILISGWPVSDPCEVVLFCFPSLLFLVPVFSRIDTLVQR